MSSFNFKNSVEPCLATIPSPFDDINTNESYLGPTIYGKVKKKGTRMSFKKAFNNSSFISPSGLDMVEQSRGTTGTLQGTNRRGNLRPKAENRIFRGNLA